MRKFISIGIFYSISVSSILANIIKVPFNYPTIQAAIVASTNGDTIVVDPGTYFENINFRGRRVVLTSKYYISKDTSFICNTIINGGSPLFADSASCIVLNHNEDTTTIIQGFTITGGLGTKWFDIHGAGTYREGGAILTEFSSPIIRWNHITSNYVLNVTGVSGTGGGGIRCGDGSPKIYDNIIEYNKAGYGSGIVMNYCNNAQVKNNIIAHNSGGQNYGGGGIWATGTSTTSLLVENNTIANNHVSGSGTYGGKGGGIFVFTTKLNTKNNIVFDNTQSTGNAIVTFFGGTVNATYSDIDFVYPGTGNINSAPLFMDTASYILSNSSPCIDAGENILACNDLTVALNVAQYPSKGTQQNDMGAFGGPLTGAFPHCPSIITDIIVKTLQNSISIYPNPSTTFINIHSTKQNITEIELLNIFGAIIYRTKPISNFETISVSNISSGIYFVSILLDNERIFKKIQIVK